jgi:hypothetical protein
MDQHTPIETTGRLDLLAMSIADQLAAKVAPNNPVVGVMYPRYRGLLESLATQYLSPDPAVNVVTRKKRTQTRKRNTSANTRRR